MCDVVETVKVLGRGVEEALRIGEIGVAEGVFGDPDAADVGVAGDP